ncbi:MAG: hypothetical protein IT423_07085, partial [Pirellulaceae bacterium]|nr:hypothetical protein [Pirellulaceae bacterium]
MDRRLYYWLSRMCGLRGWLTCGLWIWLSMLRPCPAALAQLDVVTGVINVKDTGSGPLDVKFFYESSAADAQGLLHVEVVGPKGPSLTERTFEIVFYINSQDPSAKNGVAFRTFIKMAEGTTSARAVIPFFVLSSIAYRANNQSSMNWDLAVLEEGRDVEQSRWVDRDRRGLVRLSPPARGEHQVYHTAQAGHSPTTLLYLLDDGEVPNMKQPGRLLLGQGMSGLGSQLDVEIKNSYLLPSEFGLTRNSQRDASFRHVSTAPRQWQYYLQYRIVVIESAVLSKLQASQPLVAQALKHFVSCGGSLIVRAGQTTGARRLLDQWLLGSESTSESSSESRRSSTPGTESLGWEIVRAQYGPWWQRGAAWAMPAPVDSTQSPAWGGLNPGMGKTQIDGLDGMGMESEDNPAVINEIRRAMSELRKVDQVEGPQSLTLPGILRDSMTVLDTVLESKLSSHREMWEQMTYVDDMDQDLGLANSLWQGSTLDDMAGLEAADSDVVLPDGVVDGSTTKTDGVPADGVPA